MKTEAILGKCEFFPYIYNSENPQDLRVHNRPGVVITIRKPAGQGNESFKFDILYAKACNDILQYIKDQQEYIKPDTSFLVAIADAKTQEDIIEKLKASSLDATK
jgi:hypothetical protein